MSHQVIKGTESLARSLESGWRDLRVSSVALRFPYRVIYLITYAVAAPFATLFGLVLPTSSPSPGPEGRIRAMVFSGAAVHVLLKRGY
jgi:hypothetical protein